MEMDKTVKNGYYTKTVSRLNSKLRYIQKQEIKIKKNDTHMLD